MKSVIGSIIYSFAASGTGCWVMHKGYMLLFEVVVHYGRHGNYFVEKEYVCKDSPK